MVSTELTVDDTDFGVVVVVAGAVTLLDATALPELLLFVVAVAPLLTGVVVVPRESELTLTDVGRAGLTAVLAGDVVAVCPTDLVVESVASALFVAAALLDDSASESTNPQANRDDKRHAESATWRQRLDIFLAVRDKVPALAPWFRALSRSNCI